MHKIQARNNRSVIGDSWTMKHEQQAVYGVRHYMRKNIFKAHSRAHSRDSRGLRIGRGAGRGAWSGVAGAAILVAGLAVLGGCAHPGTTPATQSSQAAHKETPGAVLAEYQPKMQKLHSPQ